MQSVIDGVGSQVHVSAVFAFIPLTGPPRSALLRRGSDLLACAPLGAGVVAKQISHEDRAYEMAMKLYTLSKPGAANVWGQLGNEQERIFQILKEDTVRWLPDAPRALEIISKTKIVLGLVCKNVANSGMDATLTACEKTGERFADYRAIIQENNSGDDTGRKALAWAARNPRVNAVSEVVGDGAREVNIAIARNKVILAAFISYRCYACSFFSARPSQAVLPPFCPSTH